jgi:CRP-like cAMP-binding protein/rhodanese-related sulfurtransferase
MSANNSIVEFLGRSQILRDLPNDVLEAIAQAVKPLAVPQHTIILREGAVGDGLYIIRSGRVRVFRRAENRMEIDLAFPGPCETFGEMALLTGEPRSANAEALEETHLLVLAKDDFDRILREFPETSKIFVKEMRRWLLRDEKRLELEAHEAYRASRLSWLDFLVVIGISVVLAIIFNASNPNGVPLFPAVLDRGGIPSISPAAAMAEVQGGNTLILDAIPENFYQKRHIKGALNMPLPLFDIIYMMTFADEDKERNIVVYGGTISKHYDLELAEKLLLRGYQNVRSLEGGLEAWEKGGYPVEEKGKE